MAPDRALGHMFFGLLLWRCDADEQRVVTVEFNGHIIRQGNVFTRPKFFTLLRAVQAELGKAEMEWV